MRVPVHTYTDLATVVKVLYTFDNENKTNCLARFPDVTSVRAIPIDETTHIGIIELKTCIQAIAAASPELVSSLNQADFTIYAYDYSEYDSPLVGQGMLSSLLAANSPTPNTPAYHSKTMITGRICKNVLGLFSNGVSETLEVKLRLVPVPRPAQQAYVNNIEAYRPSSRQQPMSSGIDFHAWSDAIHAASPGPMHGPEEYDDDDHNGYQRGFRSSMDHRRMSDASYVASQPSRSARGLQRSNTTRPSSRASVRSDYSSRPHLMPSVSESNVMDSRRVEGPSRKRAKVTQTEWRGKSVIGTSEDSLRVAASTAASIRIHKPVASRPAMPGNRSLEPPPRVPTPVAANDNPQLHRNTQRHASNLRRESTLGHLARSESPLPGEQFDAVTSSPGGLTGIDSVGCSPVDFPSSPPALPEPSSPSLPALPKVADSGYMSGSAYDVVAENHNRAIEDVDDTQVKPRHRPRQPSRPSQQPSLRSEISFIEQTPGPVELLPTKMQTQDTKSRQNAQNSITQTRRQSEAQYERPSVMQNNSSETVLSQQSQISDKTAWPQTIPVPGAATAQSPSNATLKTTEDGPYAPARARTPGPGLISCAQPTQAYVSNATYTGFVARAASPAGIGRSGSGAKRKKTIQEKLIQSVASGEMPTYCGNCGAIETPTWRSLHFKIIEGSPDDLDAAEKDSETTGIEIMEQDVAYDKVTKFRLIKSMRKCKDVQMQGFETMSVCNRKLTMPLQSHSLTQPACGLWFNKFKCMRPAHKWNVSKKKSKKSKQDVTQSDMMEPASDLPQSDVHAQQNDGAISDRPAAKEPLDLSQKADSRSAADRPRASSAQPYSNTTFAKEWEGKDLTSALARVAQSSPVRLPGSQQSPIEVADDLTPKPTCRLLFPSPRKDTTAMSIGKFSKAIRKSPSEDTASMMAKAIDKENIDPVVCDMDMDQLFGGSPSLLQNIFKTPSRVTSSVHKTPPSKSLAFLDGFPLNTPSPLRWQLGSAVRGSTGKMLMNSKATPVSTTSYDPFLPTFSSAERDSLFPRTPSRKTSQTFMSPNRSGVGGEQVMTPFTKHLTQLLNRTDTGTSSDFVLDLGSSGDVLGGMPMGLDFNSMAGLSSPGKAFDIDELSGFVSPSAFFSNKVDTDERGSTVLVPTADVTNSQAMSTSGLGPQTTS